MSTRCCGLLLLAALSLPATAAEPADAACAESPSDAVVSVKKLPRQIQEFLATDSPDRSGIADAGEKYNSSDVIAALSLPRSRFISANVGAGCARVTVERGGRGRSVQTLTFERGEHGWQMTARKHGD